MIPSSRNWWLGVAAYVVVLFAVQPWLGVAVDAAKARWGDRAFALTVTGAAVVVAAAVLVVAVPLLRRATPAEIALLAAAVALYAAGVASLDIPQERLHYLEYGGLAAFIHAGIAARAKSASQWGAAMVAVVVTSALGWLDETLQGALWERRYFDWRDVELNVRAACVGVLAAVPLFGAWRRSSAS